MMVQRAQRKIRRRRHLYQPTCRMTLAASATKTPPTSTSSSSCRATTAMNPNSPPSGKRTGIAHEHLGRMTVEPEEPDHGADHRRGKHGQFATAGDMGNV